MKVDLKQISIEKDIPYSDVLWEYVAEDFLWRLSVGGLNKSLWLINMEHVAGERLSFYYITYDHQVDNRNDEGFLLSYPTLNNSRADRVNEILQNVIIDDADINDRSDIVWSLTKVTGVSMSNSGSAFPVEKWSFVAVCDDIEVPFSIKIEPISEENAGIPIRKDIEAMNRFHKNILINTYSPESILGEQIFEIMEKLELVGDMRPFALAYKILHDNSVSGRHIIDIFKLKAQKRPNVATMRRLEQVKGYRSYAYMKKRWNQYAKRNMIDTSWEETLDLILGFLEPVWTAFCNNEIFFDDWMPELGRFLG